MTSEAKDTNAPIQRRYGDVIAHSHRLPEAPAVVTRMLRSAQIAVTRISTGSDHVGMMGVVPAEDTFIAALYLSDVPYNELWSRGRRVLAQGYAANSLRIVNLEQEYSSYVACPHEALSIHVPRAALDGFAIESDLGRVSNLDCAPGMIDMASAHLGRALLPCFDRPGEAHPLYVDHVVLALQTHLAQRYGGSAPQAFLRRGALSPLQERRAKEYITVIRRAIFDPVSRGIGVQNSTPIDKGSDGRFRGMATWMEN